MMDRTDKTFAALAGVIVLGFVTAVAVGGPPDMPDQHGKTLKQAEKAVEKAGFDYASGQAASDFLAPGGAADSETVERPFDEDDPKYADWTVCGQEVSGDGDTDSAVFDGNGYHVYLFMVEKPQDCKDKQITPTALKRYLALAEKEQKARRR